MDKDQIKAALAAENLTHVASLSKVSRRTIGRIMAGDCEPNRSTLALIEAALKKMRQRKDAK